MAYFVQNYQSTAKAVKLKITEFYRKTGANRRVNMQATIPSPSNKPTSSFFLCNV